MPRFHFAQTLVMLLVWFAPMTWFLEPAVTDRVGFMNLVPQRVPTRWLLLAPMCALGLLDSIAMVVAGRGPAIAVIAAFGCACWIIGATRWLRRIQYWPLAAPLVLVAPVAAAVVLRAVGWGAATAVSTTLGFAAVAVQPGAWLGAGSARRKARGSSKVVARRPVEQRAVSVARRAEASWLVPAAWFMRLVSGPFMRLDVWLFPLAVLGIVTFHYPGCALMLTVFAVPAQGVAAAFSAEAYDFIGPRPFSERQRWVGGLAYPLLVTLGFSALMLPCLSLDWMNGGGLVGRLLNLPFLSQPHIGYLRDVLGATFLPEKWPVEGLSQELWTRVRPLLWLDLFRATLFAVAGLFVRATIPLVGGDGKLTRPVSPVSFVLLLLVGVGALRLGTGQSLFSWVPPWWAAATLAAVAIAYWLWQIRVSKPTGSSTSG
jgi:hypothetical protein